MSEYPHDMLALLEAMKGDAWSDAQVQRYTLALSQLPAKRGRAIVQKMCLETWRPSPMDILRAAAKLASPFPTADEAYAEMLHKAETIGQYGVPDPQNPRCFLLGPPPFSHPLVAQAIQHCGGWRGICSGEAQMQEGLSKQFRGSYERVAAKWVDSVIPALALPPAQRPRELFPCWSPYKLPAMWSEQGSERLQITPLRVETPSSSEIARAMPPDIRAKLKQIGGNMPRSGKPEHLLADKQAEVETELTRIRERMKQADKVGVQ